MGGNKQRRKNNTAKNKKLRKARGTKRLPKFNDEIYEDLKPDNIEKMQKNFKIDDELTGLGQFYCISCARYFISSEALNIHNSTKDHKKRLKSLKEKPYSQEEAERAVGLSSFLKKALS